MVFNYHVYNTDELQKRIKFTNFLDTDRNYKIPYLYIKGSEEQKKLIIYSHGNSYDIYMSYSRMKTISNALKTDVIIYDYCGFGAHQLNDKIIPNEENMYKDLSDIINLSVDFGYSEIYLMGHSLGTGPSIKLASEKIENKITGLIIISGFTSVFAVAFGTNIPFIKGFDLFNNLENIKNVECKILILHGTDDDVIPVEHAKILIDNAQSNLDSENSVYFFIEERGDHNTLSSDMLKAIKEFINY